jgi:GPI-GlcNAc transferase complex PIG-U subunit
VLARALAVEPAHRKLRWILAIGLLVRLLIAPLSSWDYDTPGFVLSGVATLYTGNPYATSIWANPPLAPFLAAPFLAVPAGLFGPQSLVTVLSAVAPITAQTGVNATFVPSPAALLAWKLPFILSDLAVALLLFLLPRKTGIALPFSREALTAAWFLNPLVIWASAVHGEIDTLAILFVLLALFSLASDHWLSAGLFLGLAIFTKAYPIVLTPLVAAAAWCWPGPGGGRWKERAQNLLGLAAGAAFSALPFLDFLPQTLGVVQSKASNPNFGGISVLIIYNRITPVQSAGHSLAAFLPSPDLVLLIFRGLALLAIFGSALLVGYRLSTSDPRRTAMRVGWVILGAIWATAGILLADSVPQPENLVALLPLVLLSVPVTRFRSFQLALLALLSGAGALMYWAFLTPLAMFYPGARLFGASGVRGVNSVVIAYVHSPLLHGALMLTAGMVGGSALLLLWCLAGFRLLPEGLIHRISGVTRRRARASPTPPI